MTGASASIEGIRAELKRLEAKHGQPVVRVLVGKVVLEWVREHVRHVGGIEVAAFGVPVFLSKDLFAEEWAPVYRARKA